VLRHPAEPRTVQPQQPQRDLDLRDRALIVLTVLAVIMFLKTAAALLIPIVIGLLLSYAVNPLVVLLERVRVPRPVGAAVTVLLVVVMICIGAFMLKTQIDSIAQQLPEAAARLRQAAQSGSIGTLFDRVQQAGAELQQATQPAAAVTSSSPPAAAAPMALGNVLWQGSSVAMTVATDAVVIAFLMFFLLVAAPSYYERFVDIGPSDKRTAREVLDEMNAQIERFIVVRLVTAALVGVATAIALGLLDVENAILWGLLAGIFNSVPYFGPIIVSGGLLVVGLVQFGSPTRAAVVSAVALAITTLEGWLITPPLLGKVARMSTVAVFIGLLVWGWIWGVWGTLLAMPMLVVLQVVSRHTRRLSAISRLLDE
jgi:predicted PurR-regulated permease PerM